MMAKQALDGDAGNAVAAGQSGNRRKPARRDAISAPANNSRAVAAQRGGDGGRASKGGDDRGVIHDRLRVRRTHETYKRESLPEGTGLNGIVSAMVISKERSRPVPPLMQDQADRLARIRDLLGLTPGQAATIVNQGLPMGENGEKLGQISRFTWRRYEMALAPIPVLHLTLFCAANNISALYVITGLVDGLPRQLQDDLRERERLDADAAAGRIAKVQRTATRGIPRGKGKARNDMSQAAEVA
jgi:hypothetical protein